jgi:cysteine synthase
VGEAQRLRQLARELGPGKTVATVAVDSGFKYLAGNLYKE